uniref:Transcription initiation factor TFIID subunit 7 n=1 Tax=Panagrellus redivivus TaxID=6233 RepID=A0A7E5A197_PANRE
MPPKALKREDKKSIIKIDAEEDEVVAEIDCYHVSVNRNNFSVATLQFPTPQSAKLEDCIGRIKPVVKHLEIDYENGCDRDDGNRPKDEPVTTFAGRATSDTAVLNHALGFIDNGKAYFVEVDDAYYMRRKLPGTSSGEGRSDDASPKKASSPVRVRFARAETDAQRKRREQSSYFKTQQAEQEPWKTVDIVHAEPTYALEIATEVTDMDIAKGVKQEPS